MAFSHPVDRGLGRLPSISKHREVNQGESRMHSLLECWECEVLVDLTSIILLTLEFWIHILLDKQEDSRRERPHGHAVHSSALSRSLFFHLPHPSHLRKGVCKARRSGEHVDPGRPTIRAACQLACAWRFAPVEALKRWTSGE